MPSPTRHVEAAIGAVFDQLPEEQARFIVDGLPKLRIAAGPLLSEHLSRTSPEERSWSAGVVVAALSITDKLDGIGARRIGVTDHGRELDREGDRSFVMPQQSALMLNGEVSPTHYRLKQGREAAMQILRWWGGRNDKDVTSRPVNKQKTAVEMAALTAAHSSLAQNPDLMRWGASLGTALSLTGLIETAMSYVEKDQSQEVNSARNSKAREVSAGPLSRIATVIDEKAPNVTPSHLTTWGKRLVEAGAALAVARPNRPGVATTLYTVGSLMDTLDGSLARKKGIDGTEGMVEDVQADLEQQIAALAALSTIALRRGNKVAATNYAVATMMMPLSAYTRAGAEEKGLIVAEGGLGTRVGRGILGGVGMGLNKHRDISDIVSATLASGTVNTVKERWSVIRQGRESEYCKGENQDEKFTHDANVRRKAILPYAAAGLAVGTVLLAAIGQSSYAEKSTRSNRAA